MIIRFWGQKSRLQSIAYQGDSETDLDSDSDEGGSHNSHQFLHQHTQGAKTSLLTTMTQEEFAINIFSWQRFGDDNAIVDSMENHQGDKSRLFRANEYFYGKVVVKFSWRQVQL
jgi:hypothetical protein